MLRITNEECVVEAIDMLEGISAHIRWAGDEYTADKIDTIERLLVYGITEVDD